MRKLNIILSILIFILFLIHAIIGSFQMIGANTPLMKVISDIFIALVIIHAVIGVIYTIRTLSAQKKAGVSYFKDNKRFWTVRISGFAMIILLAFHFTAFSYNVDGAVRLHEFNALRLATQILLLASVAVHVITNIRPLMISLGVRLKSFKNILMDILIIISILILFMAIAFIIYYLRWSNF